jgi:dTDP-4-dehydrorhamnose reductase
LNILITGANGQLGSELQQLLTIGEAEIGAVPNAYAQARLFCTDTDSLDITNAAAVEGFVKAEDIDLILNCAAYTDVDGCESNQDLAYAVNVQGPKNLAIAAEKADAVLVHLSTDYVFRGDDQSPRIESDSCDPQSVYGLTKLASEDAVIAHCQRHFIIRTAWLYGYIGNNFVKTILRLARENGHIKVVDDQFGSPTSANDLAYQLLKLAQTSSYGIYHCTNNDSCSWFEFASAIVDELGIECDRQRCTTAEFPRPAHRPQYSILDNARLRASIGDEMRPWRDALRSYLNNPRFVMERNQL